MTDKLLTIIAKHIKNINDIEDATQQYYFKKSLEKNITKFLTKKKKERYEEQMVSDFFEDNAESKKGEQI